MPAPPCKHACTFVLFPVLVVLAPLAAACETEGCLRGDEGCVVPSACSNLDGLDQCADPLVSLQVLSDVNRAPGGLDAVGATGDFLLKNDRVAFVIDALEHPQHLAPTGGSILDAVTLTNGVSDDNDTTNHVFQAVGALPTDAVAYTSSQIIERPGSVSIQFNGHLVGDTRQRVHTRYELRACEPGLRVRTEMVNGSDDTVVWSNADGYWWGGRSSLPFAPVVGEGYQHPRFGLGTLNDVFSSVPWIVGANHSQPASALAMIPCNVDEVEGFHSGQVSAVGTKRRIVKPRDYEIFERMFTVSKGEGAAPGVDSALLVRDALFDEPFVTVSGFVGVEGVAGASFGNHARASLLVSQGKKSEPWWPRAPITEVAPAANGTFTFRVPANREYVVDVVAFGEVVTSRALDVGDADITMNRIDVPASAHVRVTVRVDGDLDHAQIIVHPADDDTRTAHTRRYYGSGQDCAPLLGNPAGESPACNRVLVNGTASFDLPPGRWEIYATAGLGASVARENVDLLAGESADIELAVARHALPGLSADFHVHGAKSFDSTIPDLDRVRAFLAAGVDVIAATDHDAVWDYADAMRALAADARIKLITGVETTGQVLWPLNPSVYFPQVVGHWIMWPLPFDDEAPRNGAPWDEMVEPGALFDRVAARGFDRDTGVIQLNHPWADLEFARDLGFPRAIGVRLDEPLPRVFDGTGPSLFFRTPPGATFGNADYNVQEVMNGTQNDLLLAYRAVWFYLLDQGVVRAGTANSDSHSLFDSILGTPRNIVLTDQTVADFDVDAFDRDVRNGKMFGTNGPLIEARIISGANSYTPSTQAHVVSPDAELAIVVRAPTWVPIEEVRVIVNGAAIAIGKDDLRHPADPFAPGMRTRLDTSIPLADLLPDEERDAWIVIEAGRRLPRTGDLDCDGVPDTTDNNADGEIDYRDVDRNGDKVIDALDVEDVDGPEECSDRYGDSPSKDRPSVGPMRVALPSADDDDFELTHVFESVTPEGYPFAFTNPLLLERNGDGAFTGPGLPR